MKISVKVNGTLFRYSKVTGNLYFGFKKERDFFIATPEKALLDAFYLMSYGRYSMDISTLDAGKIDKDEIKRLKIEIRTEIRDCDYQEKIAFSRFSNRQVFLKAHPLEQTMKNKIDAFLGRGEIRDCFDIEFLLRRGIEFPSRFSRQRPEFCRKLSGLKERDFTIKLGSILESDIREYYFTNRFGYLEEKLASLPSNR